MPLTLRGLEYKLDNYYNHWALKDAINSLNATKSAYEALYDSSGAITYDGMPHSTTPGNPPLEAVCQMGEKPEELQREIADQRKAILEINWMDRAIETALHSLEPPEEEIIHLRHMERMDFREIAKVTHYSQDWTKHKYFAVMYKVLHLVNNGKDDTKKH